MKNNIYTLCYAGVLGIVCAFILTAAAQFADPYKKANQKSEKISNILAVLNVPVESDADSRKLIEIFNANVDKEKRDNLTIYFYRPQGQVTMGAVAFPFSGPGLWGPIKGFIALEANLRTIRGIRFHEHEETPGLGGEIASDWFQSQFEGKSILDQHKNIELIISKNRAKDKHNQVDAITGATMTCDKVEQMLNKAIRKVVKEID